MIVSVAAAALGGFLLALAFPPAGLNYTAWIAFIPLLQTLHSEHRPLWAGLYGAVFGAVFFLIDVSWIYQTVIIHGHFSHLSACVVFLGMILSLTFFPAVFALCLCFFLRKGIKFSVIAPFVWTSLEYIRSTVFTGFPWDLTGYSQWGRVLIVQQADITGVYGISFLVLLVNCTLWELLRSLLLGRPFPSRLSAACAITFFLVVSYGTVRIKDFPPRSPDSGDFPISILQGNIPQEIKWEESARQQTFFTYERLGKQAIQEGAKLLVWPETSAPVLFGGQDSAWRQATDISERLGVPMLVGAPSYKDLDGRTNYYNSAFLVEGAMLRYRYDKIHLVPFGEYMPLAWLLPLGPGIAAREADYSAGEKMTVMRVQGGPPFSVLICYEAIFPDLARMALKNGARMLINITNDGWFGDTGAPYQHLVMAGMRSIENRVWLIRAANTGISAAFDPAGRILGRIPLQKEGILTLRVPSSPHAGSFYSRFGDVFVWSCCAIFFLVGVSAILNGRAAITTFKLGLAQLLFRGFCCFHGNNSRRIARLKSVTTLRRGASHD